METSNDSDSNTSDDYHSAVMVSTFLWAESRFEEESVFQNEGHNTGPEMSLAAADDAQQVAVLNMMARLKSFNSFNEVIPRN